MARDKNERRHRRTQRHPEAVQMMAEADIEGVISLSAAMGLVRCVHWGSFPCSQCVANRAWNEAATGKRLSEREFEEQYSRR